MMETVRSWLLAVIAVSLLCAVADALMPPGAVKRAGRLVCGLVLLAAVLSPLGALDAEGGRRWLADYFASLDRRQSELTQVVEEQRKVIIEREYAAYIVDKAAELGLTCTVWVECQASEEGLYLPVRTVVAGGLTEEGRTGLQSIIESDLGVPASEQVYKEEEMP